MCGDHTGYHAGSEGFLELCSTLKGRHEMMDCMGLVNRVFYGALKNKIWKSTELTEEADNADLDGYKYEL